MQYRKFGQLDWEVSVLGFGCMRLPVIGGKPADIDQEKTTEMIRTAVEAGVNYFDTAYPYHEQQSEIALGKALAGGYRDRVRVATKSPVWLIEKSDDYHRLLDEQLERLQMPWVDFYLFHALNRDSWEKIKQLNLLAEAEKALADGRIKNLGFSFHDNLGVFKDIVDGYDGWRFCQIQYNYMDTEFQAGTEGLQYAAGKGLAVVVMESIRGGKLALDLPTTRPIWESAPIRRKPADWALQWLWNQPEVTVALSGMSTLEQVKENIASAGVSGTGRLDPGDLALIGRVREAIESVSPIPCTRCEYCLPCPNGVNIPRNFDIYNEFAMYDNPENSRFTYRRFVPDGEKAANCIQCGECLPKCPQNIPISDWMPVVEEVLGKNKPYVRSV
ncbi:MAG: aldo/keto reductase [Anaerolineales bacterium]